MSDEKKILLENIFPDVVERVIESLAEVAEIHTYPPDAVLCHEDHYERVFYLIVEGEVVFTKRMGDSQHVLRLGHPGQFFGEMALLDPTITRSATVTTTRETRLLELELSAFEGFLKEHPAMVLAMARVITQRMRENDRQAIAELQAQKQEVEKAYEDLRRFSEQRTIFLNTLAHELRTPLTTIMGYMQLVRSGFMKGPGLQMSIEKIGANLDRLVSLINDLLFIQEIDTVEPRFREVDVKHILEEVVEKAKDYAEQQRTNLILSFEDHFPLISADADGLTRAFGHLVDNAIKFSPEGGDIIVNASTNGENIKVEVIDHGIGIDPEFMPRLFERFVRDETYKEHLFGGVGLGMPIVKLIVELHRGRIDVESIRGEGTKFTIYLPINTNRSENETKMGVVA
ncbi:MAG: cyclic nucleotide-binding domain-containing protein [Anaerolineae bacterium]|nr:MAG: cyclic nucleotide-binding domain-containing protein [Anaerolineae bacterium]